MNKTAIEWTASTQPDGTITPGYTANPIRYSDAGGPAGEGDAAMSREKPKRIQRGDR